MRGFTFNLLFVPFLIVGIISCDSGTEPDKDMPTNGKTVEIVTPVAGDSYTVGQQVVISFKVDVKNVVGCNLEVSIDGGKKWKSIDGDRVIPSAKSGGQLLSYNWVIGNEADTVAYSGTITTCKIKVYDYTTYVNDQSGVFTITQ